MTEGKLVSWRKKEGEKVSKGEVLAEIETEKAVVEFESAFSGTILKLLVAEGSTLSVGVPIAEIAEGGEKPSEPEPSGSQRVIASPAARKLAKERGIDLDKVKGSGPDGRIQLEDIPQNPDAFAKQIAVGEFKGPSSTERSREIQISPMRKTIIRRLGEQKIVTLPVTLTSEADATQLAESLPQLEKSSGLRLSYTTILVKAAALALRKHPRMNSAIEGDKIVELNQINVGVATSVEEGLVVPVIFDAISKSILEIARELAILVQKAKEGKLKAEEIRGSTFSISNLGSTSVLFFTPILNPPECAILGVGRANEKVVLSKGLFSPRVFLPLSLTFDHRIVDGQDAARFLDEIKMLLENPISLGAQNTT